MNDETSPIRYERDDTGIVTLTLDEPTASVNLMNHEFEHRLHEVVNQLEAEREHLTGVIIHSAKPTFFAGGDLEGIMAYRPEDTAVNEARDIALKQDLRRLETLGKPVVACMNGAAIGGGLEVALATHHRIAANLPRTRIGLPEVTIGLLPGAGGIVRTTRMFGVVKALSKVILSGKRFTVAEAHDIGLVDEVVETVEELDARARAFISANPTARQPWDQPGFTFPGPTQAQPNNGHAPLTIDTVLQQLPAELQAQATNRLLPAAGRALAAAVEGAHVDIDTASVIETQHFVWLATDQVSKNLIKSMFYDLTAFNKSESQLDRFDISAADNTAVIGTRIVTALLEEAQAMVAEGVDLTRIEQAAIDIGYTVTPRQLSEKLSTWSGWLPSETEAASRETASSGNFQDITTNDLQERMLFAQALESVRCLDEGVLRNVAEANVGSLLGFGYPTWTGGVLQYITQYPGGTAGFVARARELEAAYGSRFTPPPSLVARAENGESYV